MKNVKSKVKNLFCALTIYEAIIFYFCVSTNKVWHVSKFNIQKCNVMYVNFIYVHKCKFQSKELLIRK